jgi:hypothetical protein
MYNTDIPSRAELPTSRQLLRSTVIAVVAALAILLTAVLPGEYGIDPTGIGRPLGLTRMGEIKMELAREAALDRIPPSLAAPASTPAPAVPVMRAAVMSVLLEPGAGIEIKLVMKKGAKAQFEWTAAGGVLNCDTHGEPDEAPSKTHYYKRSSGVPGDSGSIEAAFDGHHGWFWRNRNAGDVTVTVRAFGEFSAMKRVM